MSLETISEALIQNPSSFNKLKGEYYTNLLQPIFDRHSVSAIEYYLNSYVPLKERYNFRSVTILYPDGSTKKSFSFFAYALYNPSLDIVIYTTQPHLKYFRNEGYDYYKDDLDTVIEGYTLRDWIEYGNICEDCGVPFIDYQTINSSKVCTTCEASYEPRNYSYRVEEDLGFEETKETKFGIELEYEQITGRDVMKNLRGHALPKRDGSINNGVEIVTRPACIKTHKEKLEKFFNKVKVQAKPNTGMHVHVEKAKLSQYQIGFIMEFLNSDNLTAFNHIIAGREYSTNTYTSKKKEHRMTYGISFQAYNQPLLRAPTDKYSPLNTSKSHTVEFRIFSSPESHLECCAKLDFVNALIKYSSPYAISVKRLKDKFSTSVFLNFINENKKEFKDFHNYFIKSGKLNEVTA